jgi:hypothetical protein
VFSDPIASPFRPIGPTAILIFPPSVSDPAAMNDFYECYDQTDWDTFENQGCLQEPVGVIMRRFDRMSDEYIPSEC